MKYSTALSGKNSRNSEQSWAARVLLWASTRVGFWTFSMTEAMVKVLPEPVTPSSVCSDRPFSMPCASFAMAWGWSPAGRYSE